jgi:Protein of unknown function (DUF2505)
VHFEISHELDAPVDVIELAFLSPDMGRLLAEALAPSIESVETVLHQVEDGELRRTLRFQASAPLSIFKGVTVAREALCWETFAFYRLADHTSTWEVKPREQYRRYFRASGTYHLEAIPEGRTRRVVAGDLEILVPVPMLGGLVERVALAEVRKTYDAEADTLRKLATL